MTDALWVGDWMPLSELRDGAVFMTSDGVLAMKTECHTFDGKQCDCYLLESGEAAHFKDGDATEVREIQVNPQKKRQEQPKYKLQLKRAKAMLDIGNDYPFDAPDAWNEQERREPLHPVDAAHAAARGIVEELRDRRKIKQGFVDLDEEVRKEIVEIAAMIIRLAMAFYPVE